MNLWLEEREIGGGIMGGVSFATGNMGSVVKGGHPIEMYLLSKKENVHICAQKLTHGCYYCYVGTIVRKREKEK